MKKIIAIISAVVVIMSASACNKQVVDLTYKFDKAIVRLANGEVVEGKLQSWMDYENSDQIQVKIDGKSYLVHAANCTLIDE